MNINRPLSKTSRVTQKFIIRPSYYNHSVLHVPAFQYQPRSIFKSHLTPATINFGNKIAIFKGTISRALPGTQARIISTFTMSSKLIPSNPSDVAVIRTVTPNVVTVSVPFARFGIVRVGGRGTIIRLTSGTLAVFSPVALTPEVQAKVSELGGNVGYIIAGDIEHHIFITEWAKAYPSAKILGPQGLAEKRAKVHDDPKIGHEPFAFEWTAANRSSNAVSDEFAADFEVEYVDAHPNKEVVLLYKPDRVLIEADLVFNLPAIEQYSRVPEAQKGGHALLNRMFESVSNTSGEAKGVKRFLWYAISNGAKDRPGFNRSIQRIGSWDFDTLIPCHGETIVGGAKEVFNKVFEWHLQGHK
ncbi:uncharacterized protein F4807DRAFT_414381 [Annulohypoxylon truncatum]|uniref:uncharacterized protein n=1 Tax=Annulohypoxylon truncatum TaxID=327061 RepID=UPI0020073ED2|nr:uncharacterized protein F4807DRAFT_414381 [Annulohypoxylon truncatum]KAI1212771.1 hypothetical protein F4807DRAFT_414381 [Annulohypoxylon truncatum]